MGSGSGVRHRAERIALASVAAAGVLAPFADFLGWLDKLAPGKGIPNITLLVLSTVTVFLLLEIGRLEKLDDVHAQISRLDIEAMAHKAKQTHYGGVVKVHRRFPQDEFRDILDRTVREVTVLQTWIPNLEEFDGELKAALERGVPVRILLLHPSSPVAKLRDEALSSVRDPALGENVKAGVERCLSILETVYENLPRQEDRARLRVRVYNALPSIAVYKTDDRYLVSSFLHGRLAINSAQIEIDGSDTVMGAEVQRELDTLWMIGRDVDPGDWRGSIATINL